MKLHIPPRFTPALVIAAIGALGVAFYIANVIFAEPAVGDCCANGFDPYETVAPETP